jgi:hypothetical protein
MNSKFSRTCVGCGKITDKGSFIRIVRNNEGRITVDETGSMNGRGAYICPSADCLEKALKRHGLERSFKMPVPKETIECISEFLREHTT